MLRDFSQNMRLLCSYRPSISMVASDLGIHRSQLNRYLAGTAIPRAPLMRRIGDYFGVEVHELMMPHEDFAELVSLRGIASDTSTRDLRSHLDRVIRFSDHRIRKLEGTFFEYYYSMSTPGLVLRSLLGFEMKGDLMTYRRLERIGPIGQPSRRQYRYVGASVMTGDRVFLQDYEVGAGIELTQTILVPDYSQRWSTLHGVKLGVAANSEHLPCAVRVVLERTPPRASVRASLQMCGLFAPDSPDLPNALLAMIDNRQSGPTVFNAFSR
ncbi:helix-turn-helix transcriptional regulator [Tabrizicola sp.]|uniref:helix-turn-helix domain-containing protein n=1 Tax=Tabrizicola sp. TaxID=2005166 RepID=UPI0026033224|nr:helix-turn-helix transcriptional regulator [Tabrizicola sp.]MDM7931509.1 helix-turn-helix transcriptional regulator [Tabrizicola sp.]